MLMKAGGPPLWNGSHFSGTLGSVAHGDYDINIMGISKWNYPQTTGFHFITPIEYALLCSMPRETSGLFNLMKIFSPDILLGIALSYLATVALVFVIGKLSGEDDKHALAIRYSCLMSYRDKYVSLQFSGDTCQCFVKIMASTMG